MRATAVDWADERGQVGGFEAIPFGLLIFVAGALLVANAWAVIDTKMATASAAREAARTFVESTDATQAYPDAIAAASEAVAAYGRDAHALRVTGPDGAADLIRCRRVSFTASYPVPAITLPWIGGFGTGFSVRSTATQIVDPYREGVPGEADCG